MTWVGTAIAGGAVIGGFIESNASKSAANTQAGAAENAQKISQDEFNTITRQEQPFMKSGVRSMDQLDYLLGLGSSNNPNYAGVHLPNKDFGSLLQPFNMQDWKQLSPAYNFQRQQGMQGVLNADTAGAGALSGSAQKDLMSFNNQLANTSFNNAFNMYQTQQGNIFDRLAGVMQLGQSAAANTGQQGTALAGQSAQSATNIGTAEAAGQIGAANAYAGALGTASYMPWLMSGTQMQPQAGQSAGGL